MKKLMIRLEADLMVINRLINLMNRAESLTGRGVQM
jgi:hypothetical protein